MEIQETNSYLIEKKLRTKQFCESKCSLEAKRKSLQFQTQ